MSTPNDTFRFLSVREAAKSLKVGAPTIRRWIDDGHLRAVQPGGERGAFRIPEDEIFRLVWGQQK